MINITKLLNSRRGKIILSIMWGVGLAALLCYQVCDGPQCIVFQAPSVKEIKSNVFHQDGNCYNFVPYSVPCANSKCPVKNNPKKGDTGGKCNNRA